MKTLFLVPDFNKLKKKLHTTILGKNIFFAHETSSTNDWAKELVEHGATEGTITIAEIQTTGRGRFGRKWISPKGGLWLSIILKPKIKPRESIKLVFLASLAVAEVLHELYTLDVQIKWPNDILINKRKVCGILIETSIVYDEINYIILGIGINANFNVQRNLPKVLWDSTTSLEDELGRKVDLEKLFKALIEKLDFLYKQFLNKEFDPILKRWKNFAKFFNHVVRIKSETTDIQGIALGIDNNGALILRLKNGSIRHIFIGNLSTRNT